MPDETKIDLKKLYSETGKPIIQIGELVDGEVGFTWNRGTEMTDVTIVGLNRWVALEVLKGSTIFGVVPEALRVASLTLFALPEHLET